MKFDSFFKTIIENDIKNNIIPMLLGGPGIGKSSWIGWFANQMGTRSFTLACNQLGDKSDLTGARLVPVLDKDGNQTGDWEQRFFPHQSINEAIRYAEENKKENPILFLDEINRTTSDITSALLSLATDRKIGNKELPKNLRIMIAGNDKGNVSILDKASISRFTLYYMKPCVETFLSIHPNLNIFVRNVLQKNPQYIYEERPIAVSSNTGNDDEDETEVDIDMLDEGDEMMQITTPRTLEYISNFLNSIDQNDLIKATTTVEDGVSLIEELITGKIGRTNFAMLLTQEVINNCMTVNTSQNANVLVVDKPDYFDDLTATPTIKELENKIMALSDHEKSMCLVYALQDNKDNANIMTILSNCMHSIEPDARGLLMNLAISDRIDEDNLNAFTSTGSDIAEKVKFLAGNVI